jgi:hypothetical protein
MIKKMTSKEKLFSCMHFIQHCFLCRPSDFTVPGYAGIEPKTVATLALTGRRFNHLARSHPQRENVTQTFYSFNIGVKNAS